MKYNANMSYNDLLRNARDIGTYFSHKDLKAWSEGKHDYSGLKCVGSWPDVNFWVDADGNIWEEYVPTYD